MSALAVPFGTRARATIDRQVRRPMIARSIHAESREAIRNGASSGSTFGKNARSETCDAEASCRSVRMAA